MAFDDVLEGVQDGPHGAVCVAVDVHIEAGQVHRLDLGLDVFGRQQHAVTPGRVVAEGFEQLGAAVGEGAVGPHLAGLDLDVFGAEPATPVDQFGRDGRRVVLLGAGPHRADDPHGQITGVVAVDQTHPHRCGGGVLHADEHPAVDIGRHPHRGGDVEGSPLCLPDGFGRGHAAGDEDRKRRALDGKAGGCAVGIAMQELHAGLQIRRFGADTGGLHRGGVEPGFVHIGVEHVHRTIAGDLIEPFPSGMLRAEGAARRPPVTPKRRICGLSGDPFPDGLQNGVLTVESPDVHPEFGDAERSQMIVPVDESGQQHPIGKIDDPGVRSTPIGSTVGIADVDDLPAPHRDDLGGGLFRIDRVDGAVLEQPVRAAVPRIVGPVVSVAVQRFLRCFSLSVGLKG